MSIYLQTNLERMKTRKVLADLKNRYVFSQNRYRWLHFGYRFLQNLCYVDIAAVLYDRTEIIF